MSKIERKNNTESNYTIRNNLPDINQSNNLYRIKIEISKILEEDKHKIDTIINDELEFKKNIIDCKIIDKEEKITVFVNRDEEAYRLYNQINKRANMSGIKLKIKILLCKTKINDYKYPDKATNNVNIKNNKLYITNLTDNNKNDFKNEIEVNKLKKNQNNKTKSTSLNLHKNILNNIDYSKLGHDIIKIRNLRHLNQQKILNNINPSFNRITSPFKSKEEEYLYNMNDDKKNWIDRNGFRLYIKDKIPIIKNYVGIEFSNPPVINYIFRSIQKEKWINKKDFKVR